MKITFSILLLMIFSLTGFGQKKDSPPEGIAMREKYSSVYDIRDFEKFYVRIDFKTSQKSVAPILKILKSEPSLKLAKSWDDAQFIVTYREKNDRCRMQVYYVKEKAMIIVWTEERKGKGKESELAEAFLQVLQRNKKLDVPDVPGDAE